MTTSRPIFGAILAAGYGSRMRPLTDALPKPLLPFLNVPIIAYTIDHLVRAGVQRFGVNLHHKADLIPPVVEQFVQVWQAQGITSEAVFVHEAEVRGTAGGVAGIWEALGSPDATLVVINGDPVMNMDLSDEIARHQASGADATMLVRPKTAGHPGGVWVNADDQVCGLRDVRTGEGVAQLEFMGVHILEPRALERVTRAAQQATSTCMVGDVYIPMLKEGAAIRTSCVDDFWVALDNPELLLDATCAVLDNPECFKQAPFSANPSRIWVSSPGEVDAKTLFRSPVFLGAYAAAERGARVGPHVVADATVLAPQARVSRAILFGMGRVEGQWEGCVAVQGKIAQVT